MEQRIRMELKTRWKDLMDHFQFGANEMEYESILDHYNENHRAYHNLIHIQSCLNQLDHYTDDIPEKGTIELAIWYHDIIYNPYGKENELKSAHKAAEFLGTQNADKELIENVRDLIMATLHSSPPKNTNEAIIMDIDITILGSREEIYLDYTKQIRKEYKWIPGILYRKKRKEIMKQFLRRPRLYYTPFFFDKFEKQARANIADEVATLS